MKMSDFAKVLTVRARYDTGEPPALHMLPSMLWRRWRNAFELLETSRARGRVWSAGSLPAPGAIASYVYCGARSASA